jgi:hypothetical protein
VRAPSHPVAGVLAGVGVFLVETWPLTLIWWAGDSGAVGDFSQLRFLGISLLVSVVVATAAGWSMSVALRWAEATPGVGRLDPWGAYATAIGVYSLALTAVPAILYLLLLTDEDTTLRSREWLAAALWIGGSAAAVIVSFLAGRWLLMGGRHHTAAGRPGTTSGRTRGRTPRGDTR